MPVLGSFNINNFSGPLLTPDRPVPAGAQKIVVEFDGTTMLDPAVEVDTAIEFAPDGVTFHEVGAIRFRCGAKERDGVTPRQVYPVGTTMPLDGPNPRARGRLNVTGGQLTTVATIRTEP